MFKLVLVFILIIVFIIIIENCNKLEKFTLDSGIPGPNFLAIGTIHGNEPASSYALESIINDFKSKRLILKKGSVTIIPCLNKCGRMLGIRFQPQELLKLQFWLADGNRTYPKNNEYTGRSEIAKDIIPLVNFSDAVFDGHEGYSYVRLNSGSMGNGIFPGTTRLSIKAAKDIETVLNTKIPTNAWYKKYKAITNWNTSEGTLRNYCNRKNIHYMLMETAGQGNIEPLNKRVKAQKIVCLEFMKKMGNL
jgi:predicted deacylase